MTTTEILNFNWAIVQTTIVHLQQLEKALHQEWQNPQNRIRRFTGSMRRVQAVMRVHGGYTRS